MVACYPPACLPARPPACLPACWRTAAHHLPISTTRPLTPPPPRTSVPPAPCSPCRTTLRAQRRRQTSWAATSRWVEGWVGGWAAGKVGWGGQQLSGTSIPGGWQAPAEFGSPAEQPSHSPRACQLTRARLLCGSHPAACCRRRRRTPATPSRASLRRSRWVADWVGGESRDWWLAAAGLLLRQGQCLPARMRSAAAFHSLPAVLH